jgi:hypothetical protein
MRVRRVRLDRLVVFLMTPRKQNKALRIGTAVYSTATINLRYYPDQASRPDFVIPESNAAKQIKRGFVPESSLIPGF